MADDHDPSQATEQPTAKRLEQARESGHIVKSSEVSTFVLLLGGTLAILMFGRSTAIGIASQLTVFIEQPEQLSVDGAGLAAMLRGTLMHLGLVMAPFAGVMLTAALAGRVLQSRPSFNASKLMPDFSKLSPLAGLRRLFGLEGWINLLKGLAKIAIVGMAIWTQLWPERGRLESIMSQTPAAVVGDMSHLLFNVLSASLPALLVIAGSDYFVQYNRFMQRNRMSKQEIKEEYRQNEGDPAIKANVRQIHNERAKKRMMAAVPTATVVIANPTHYAVALKYESGKTEAPICVAKGIDALALRIRATAVEVDEAAPPELYKAMAQVIEYVMRLNGKLARR